MNNEYKTLIKDLESEIKVQRSKFIANAIQIESMDEFSEKITLVKKKYFDASHHPYAFILNGENSEKVKYSDDGEPSLSSGKPILDAINKHCLKNVAVIVTRYFGGVKLGVGGLRRAYFKSADECLINAGTKTVYDTSRMILIFDYGFMNSVMRYLQESRCKIIENDSDEKVKLDIEFAKSDKEYILRILTEISNGTIEIYES